MKFSYTLIKKLLPKAPPISKTAELLNSHSFEVEEFLGDLLDVNLSANRYSDSASHIGLAREVGVILGTKLINPVKTIVNLLANQGFIKVKINEPKFCSRYAARYFEISKIGKSSPEIEKILKTCGLKPINNMVDIMNLAMLETGQPLHVFDFDKLEAYERGKGKKTRSGRAWKEIIVRRAKKGEKIETLDGQKFELDQEVLVIADFKKPLAIAGIKGGQGSGVTSQTKRIIVEAANFDPVNVFKTSRKLKLNTDASLRFSHGLSPVLVQIGLDRATELLKKDGAILMDSIDFYPKPIGDAMIEFDTEKYEKLIGKKIELAKAKKIFGSLGFPIEPSRSSVINRKLLVRIPAWRTDIQTFEGLTEEIARIDGFNGLKPVAPFVSLKTAGEEDTFIFKDRIRNFLMNLGFDEVYNSSFVGDAEMSESFSVVRRAHQRSSALVELENPISEDKKYLRVNLLALLIENIKDNSRFFNNAKIFEIGKIFKKMDGMVNEELSLGLALAKNGESGILHLKGIANELIKSFGITDLSIVHHDDALRLESGHNVLGFLKEEKLNKGLEVSLGEINLNKLLDLAEGYVEFRPLPRYPAIVRDISLIVNSDVRIGIVLEIIQRASPKLIQNVDLMDQFTDERITKGNQSLTFRIVFQAEDRTLTDIEVNHEMDEIVAHLKKDFRAEIR
jgi:phenylalanyl-tRNA synthetase beta chain